MMTRSGDVWGLSKGLSFLPTTGNMEVLPTELWLPTVSWSSIQALLLFELLKSPTWVVALNFFFRPILAERGGETWRPGNPSGFFRENRQTIGIVYSQIVWTKPQAEQTVTNPSIWTIFKLFTVNKVWFTHKVGAVSTGLSRTLVHLIRGTCE